jgi:hypothetical protein
MNKAPVGLFSVLLPDAVLDKPQGHAMRDAGLRESSSSCRRP